MRNWEILFKDNGFESLITEKDNERELEIKTFCDRVEEKFVVPPELIQCYINEYGSEMYLIIDGEKDIENKIDKWNSRIMALINFGNTGYGRFDNKKEIFRVRYNIYQIYLVPQENEEDIKMKWTEYERKTNVSRLLFLEIDTDKNIIEEDKTYLPFFFEIHDNSDNLDQKLVENLKKIMQEIENKEELQFLFEETTETEYTKECLESVRKWVDYAASED